MFLVALLLLAVPDTLPTAVRERYTQTDVMIPMRDGARLFTTVYAPRDTTNAWPMNRRCSTASNGRCSTRW